MTSKMIAIPIGILFLVTVARAGVIPGVFLNEVVSHPMSGTKEWVELYNESSTPIDLTGWKLTDLADPQGTPSEQLLKNLTGIINPGEYLVVEVGSTKLNNAGDSVTLYDAGGVEVDRVTLGANVIGYTPNSRNPALVGMSASRFGSVWIVSLATKGATNTPPAWSR